MKRGVLVAMGVGLSVLPRGDAQAAPGESSFTPQRFVMPIYSIMLARGLTVNVPLYSCRTSPRATSGSDLISPAPEADAGLSSGGEPFSGFLRRVYSHDSTTPSVSYDVPLREITKNADATLDGGAPLDAATLDAGTAATYDVYAIGDPFQDLTRYRVRFPRFELQDHNGTFFTANGASQVDYRAIKR